MNNAKILLLGALLTAGANASVIYAIDFDLSSIHPGSMLSGSVTVPNAIPAGSSTPLITLSFTDPSDYNPTSLSTTLEIENPPGGTTIRVRFSPISFTNLNPPPPILGLNFSEIDLSPMSFAVCGVVDVPCQATGPWVSGSPAAFSGTYSISTSNVVPEPSYTLLMAALGTCLFLRRRAVRQPSV